jgi:asparagine N-glycosylation enzyme membrane subunit Stt3
LTAWWPFSSNRLNMMADIMFDDVNMIEMMIKMMIFVMMISQDESSSWFFMMFHVNVTDHHPIFEGKTEWFHYKNTAQLVSSHHNKRWLCLQPGYPIGEIDCYPLVIWHSHGKSLINGGFNGKIIYKWAMFHGYVYK